MATQIKKSKPTSPGRRFRSWVSRDNLHKGDPYAPLLEKKKQKSLRRLVHIGMSFLIVCVVILFKHVLDRNVIDGLLTGAGYTYGPLLGLFVFGIFTSYKIKDRYVWWVVVLSVVLTALIANIESDKLGGYIMGYELLPLNGIFTFLGLILIRSK